MSQKLDIVYVLGNGSTWQNREIWFSLASVAKNLKGVGRVFVVGSNPGFLSNEVTFIQANERYDPKLNPAANVISKLLAAIKAGVSENFILMNDDFVILKETVASEIPFVHKGKFSQYGQEYFTSGNYKLRMRKTFAILQQRKLPDYNFGVHVPMRLNVSKLKQVLANSNWKEGVGISLRTLYGNMYCVNRELKQVKDPNLNRQLTLPQLQERFKAEQFMSYNDFGLNRNLKLYLQSKLPKQHKYAIGELPAIPKRQINHKRI